MIRLPPRSTRTDTVDPDTTHVRSHRRLGDQRVGDEGRFHLRRAHAVAGDVDHVVDPTSDPVIVVLVAAAAVAAEILAVVGRKIGLNEAVVVAMEGTRLAGPASGDAPIALGRASLS